MNPRNPRLLCNGIFLGGLILLWLNDHHWKAAYHNWVTGKLSDVTGLLIFPFFLQFLFPRLKGGAALATGLLFIVWKAPLSEPLIRIYNTVTPLPITRTVDVTDLLALAILPVAEYCIGVCERRPFWCLPGFSLKPIWILLPASYVFMATSPPVSFYMKEGGDVYLGKSYKVAMGEAALLKAMEAQGWEVHPDSASTPSRTGLHHYTVSQIVLPEGRDTIDQLAFSLMDQGDHTLVLLHNLSFAPHQKFTNWRTLRRYARRYRKQLQRDLFSGKKVD